MKKKNVAILLITACLLLTACNDSNKNLSVNNPKDKTEETKSSEENNTENISAVEKNSNEENTQAENKVTDEGKNELKSENKSGTDLSQATQKSSSPVLITYKNEEQSYQDEDGTEYFYYTLSYPVIDITDNSEAANLINADMQNLVAEYRNLRNVNLEDAKGYYEVSKSSENSHSFVTSSDYYDFYEQRKDANIISFESQNSTYLGGAHGYTFFRGHNYDARTGQPLTLDDIFEDRTKSMAQIKEHVLFLCSLPYYEALLYPDMESSLETDLDSVLDEDYWYLATDGLHFISNPYVLGPYAAGRFDFVIPYEKIPGLKEEYQYNTGLLHSSMLGETITSDLDGDNLEDTIMFAVANPFAAYMATEEVTETTFTLEINGTDFTDDFMNAAVYMTDNICNHYYVVDLDTSDNYKELLIIDYDYNDNNRSLFFRYENNAVTYLGMIPDSPQSDTFYINGDGTINTKMRLNLLQTTSTNTLYELKDGTLAPIETDWYEVDYSNWHEEQKGHAILQDVTVYTEPNLEGKTITLTPDDGPVSFPATDNEHWYQIKTKDDQIYYLYLTDFLTMPNQGIDMNAQDIFENLLLAG